MLDLLIVIVTLTHLKFKKFHVSLISSENANGQFVLDTRINSWAGMV